MIIKEIRYHQGNLYLRRTVLCERASDPTLAGRHGYSEGVSPRGDALIFMHEIFLPDPDRHLHSHPWTAKVRVVCGSYREEYINAQGQISRRIRWTGDEFTITPSTVHRIDRVDSDPVVTLLEVGERTDDWGFFVDGRMVPWREYLTDRNTSRGDGGAT